MCSCQFTNKVHTTGLATPPHHRVRYSVSDDAARPSPLPGENGEFIGVSRSRPLDQAREAQWSKSIDLHGPRLRRYVRSFQHDEDEAADLIQGTWVRAAESFDPVGGEPIGWPDVLNCCRVVARERERLRRRDRVLSFSRGANESASGQWAEEDFVKADELCDLAWDCLLRLAPRQREVVIYRRLLGKSERETAAMVGCAVGSVKSHYHRGMEKLRLLGDVTQGRLRKHE
jgi:RNA polymerase sigma factor (sigma-70 family)